MPTETWTTPAARSAAAPAPRLRFPLRALRALLDRWAEAERERRNLQALLSLPDHLMKDVGVTRGDLRLALRRARRR
jgi:uncharacterized protein YjiS (DUF1127 family)